MAQRIYTRTGDAGSTGLFGGQRVAKNDLRVEAYGAVDELNASIGAARASGSDGDIDAVLGRIQHTLFSVGADLSTPPQEKTEAGRIPITRLAESYAVSLEAEIDRFEAELSPLKQFILPGGCMAAAALHVSRTVCRRAERQCVTLTAFSESNAEEMVNPEIVRYLNRLSDLLFVLARAANARAGHPDVFWTVEDK